MQKLLKISIVPLLTLFLFASGAMAYTIADNYIGAAPTHSSYVGQDVIGAGFDIQYLDVVYEAGVLDVKIYTDYADNIGRFYTDVGDLFISTDGWNPYGTAPYLLDQASNGEDWEYVLHIDGDDDVGLYAVNDENIVLSYVAYPTWIYRAGQEVEYAPDANESALAYGSWGVDQTDDFIWFTITYDFGNSLAFHWAETCGNDTIEGAASIPEPSNMFLLGTALIGLAGLGRKKLFKS